MDGRGAEMNAPEPKAPESKEAKAEPLRRHSAEGLPNVEVAELADSEVLFYLDPESLDPELQYGFVQERDANILKRKIRGYRFVTEEDGVRTLSDVIGPGADGRIRVGDTVLMCVKKDYKERRQKELEKRSRMRLEGPERRFLKKAKQMGVKVERGFDEKERRRE
jgi:hypothetical protein